MLERTDVDIEATVLFNCVVRVPGRDEVHRIMQEQGIGVGVHYPPLLPPRDGFLYLDRDKFHGAFAADLPAQLALFMADYPVGAAGRGLKLDGAGRAV